jgi:uncharacterized membrane protein YhaH (DUF805 family)
METAEGLGMDHEPIQEGLTPPNRPIGSIGDLFSFEGRINRALFFAILAGVWLIVFAAFAIDDLLGGVVLLASFWVMTAASVKRAHDFDQPGPWILLTMVPFAGLIFGMMLWFQPGTKGQNRYGPDPLGRAADALRAPDGRIR